MPKGNDMAYESNTNGSNTFCICFLTDLQNQIFYYLVVEKKSGHYLAHLEEQIQNKRKIIYLLDVCNSENEIVDLMTKPIVVKFPYPFGEIDVSWILNFDRETWRKVVRTL